MIAEKSIEVSGKEETPLFVWSLFFRRVELVLSVINQMCIGFITIYMTWLCARNKMTHHSSLHAWLTTIGFMFLMAEGIMTHYENNVLTMRYKRKVKTRIHWMLQLLGGACGCAGVIVALLKFQFPLFSLHGKLGFSAFILCLVSMLSGLVAFLSGPLRHLLGPLLNKAFHNTMGITTFFMTMVTLFYGLDMHLLRSNAPTDFRILLKALTLLALVLTCIGPLKALYNKIGNLYQ